MKLSITKVAAIAFMLVAGSAISTAANAQSTTASAGLNPVTLYKANSAKSFATLYPIDGTGYAGEGAYAVFDFTPSAAISGPVTGVSLSLFDEDYGNDAAGLLDVYVTSDETDATNSSPTGPLVTVPSGLVGNTTIPTTAFSNLDFLGQFNWTKTAAEGTEETETLTGADSNALTDITDGSAYSLVLSTDSSNAAYTTILGYNNASYPNTAPILAVTASAPAPETSSLVAMGAGVALIAGLGLFGMKRRSTVA